MKLVAALPALFLGNTAAAPNTPYKTPVKCGTAPMNPFIVGGQEAPEHAFPWQVSLRQGNNCRHFCGGSIISDEWIVTAAHCVRKGATYYVATGEHKLCENRQDTTKMVKTAKVIPHEDYNDDTVDNDIALLKLSKKLNFGQEIQPICLQQKSSGMPKSGYVTGWGALNENGPGSQVLQEVKVPMISTQDCKKVLGNAISNNMICAGEAEGGKDSCQGDSGGPLVHRSQGANDWTLIGVVSWGFGCARPNKPGVYTKVSEYTKWIEDHTGLDIGGSGSGQKPPATTAIPETPPTSSPPPSTDLNQCGQPMLQTQPGSISSKNYPAVYENDLSCNWFLQAPEGDTIELSFKPAFNIEVDPTPGKDCSYDFVSVNDPADLATIPKEFCGTTAPTTIRSTSNVLSVNFISDHNTVKQGFAADWTIIPKKTTTEPTTTLSTTTTTVAPTLSPIACSDSVIVNDKGFITGSRTSAEQDECYIRVAVPKNHGIKVFADAVKPASGCLKIHSMAGQLFHEKPLEICREVAPGAELANIADSDTITVHTDGFVGDFKLRFESFLTDQAPPPSAEQCGKPAVTPNLVKEIVDFSKVASRVIGGSIAVPHSYPWQASMRSSSGRHFCGGSLINDQWVLTAAHCGLDSTKHVVLGDHLRSDTADGKRYNVVQVITHPKYSTNGPPDYDFQLVKLAEPVKFNQKTQPICLPEKTEQFVGDENCVITGWGLDEIGNDNTLPNELLQAVMPTMSNDDCKTKWGSRITERMICAGSESTGGCNGDSGGPLVCKRKDGSWRLAGVVSWGRGGCDPSRTPTVFARVTSVLDWIKASTSSTGLGMLNGFEFSMFGLGSSSS